MKTINIEVPEGKVSKQVATDNGILITFEDEVVKDWMRFVSRYAEKNQGLAGIYWNHWPRKEKFGLLDFMAGELGRGNWEISVNGSGGLSATVSDRNYIGTLFSESATEQAIKIIPVDFIKNF